MSTNQLIEEIKNILSRELDIHLTDVNQETILREAGIDSIALMALLIHLENKFKISLDQLFLEYNQDITFEVILNLIDTQINSSK